MRVVRKSPTLPLEHLVEVFVVGCDCGCCCCHVVVVVVVVLVGGWWLWFRCHVRCELLARRFRSGGRDRLDACGHPCFRVHSTCFFDVWICLEQFRLRCGFASKHEVVSTIFVSLPLSVVAKIHTHSAVFRFASVARCRAGETESRDLNWGNKSRCEIPGAVFLAQPVRTRPRYQFVLPVLSGIFFQFGLRWCSPWQRIKVSSIKPGGGFKYFYFHPHPGKIPILTNIFQTGWNHQLEV